jgi:adenine/guanine phosphoribosyltransferase-like PRPP-binding protein
MTIDDYLERNIVKMQGRMKMYLPDINLEDYIRNIPDFPLPGIQFKDISPMLQSPQALDYVTKIMTEKCRYADVIM